MSVAALRGPAAVTVAVAAAAIAGFALAQEELAVVALVVAAALYVLLAPGIGAVAAGVVVLTAGMPFYGTGWFGNLRGSLGLFTLTLVAFVALLAATRWREWRVVAASRGAWVLAGFIGIVLLSLVVTSDEPVSREAAKTYLGRAFMFPLALLLALGTMHVTSLSRTLSVAVRALVAVALVGSLLAIPQVAAGIAYLAPGPEAAAADLDQYYGKRAIGVAESSGAWGAFVALALALVMVRLTRTPSWPLAAIALLLSLGLVLSGLRSGIAAILLVALLVAFAGSGRRRLRLAGLGALVLAIALAFSLGNFRSFVAGGAPDGQVEIGGGRLGVDESAEARYQLTRAELELGIRHPLTGVGLGRIGPELASLDADYLDTGESRSTGVVPGAALEKHNVYAGLFAELGLPGAILFVAALAAAAAAGLRARRQASGELRLIVDGLLAALLAAAALAAFTEADRQVFLWWVVGALLGVRAALLRDQPTSAITSSR